jgi:hypothetical protein
MQSPLSRGHEGFYSHSQRQEEWCSVLPGTAPSWGMRPPADLWCAGPILEAVQRARIFPDSKDFVDSPLRPEVSYEEVSPCWLHAIAVAPAGPSTAGPGSRSRPSPALLPAYCPGSALSRHLVRTRARQTEPSLYSSYCRLLYPHVRRSAAGRSSPSPSPTPPSAPSSPPPLLLPAPTSSAGRPQTSRPALRSSTPSTAKHESSRRI